MQINPDGTVLFTAREVSCLFKLVAATSDDDHAQMGLTPQESDVCLAVYAELDDSGLCQGLQEAVHLAEAA
ncbi:hypothetical protein [Hydrocarboniphaga effusa]|uniref:hypothetical protein n=1 Tax=Hydrocarboniphaga effusa TaxID=243629 RepID=UPI00398BF857